MLFLAEHVESTQTTLAQRLKDGKPDRACLAFAQSHGKGRFARSWHSPRGNFYASLVIASAARVDPQWPSLSLICAAAVADAIKTLIPQPEKIAVKWPNDVLLHHQKIAGILLETVQTSQTVFLIAGIGINLRVSPELTPSRLPSADGSDVRPDAYAIRAGTLASTRVALPTPLPLFSLIKRRIQYFVALAQTQQDRLMVAIDHALLWRPGVVALQQDQTTPAKRVTINGLTREGFLLVTPEHTTQTQTWKTGEISAWQHPPS